MSLHALFLVLGFLTGWALLSVLTAAGWATFRVTIRRRNENPSRWTDAPDHDPILAAEFARIVNGTTDRDGDQK